MSILRAKTQRLCLATRVSLAKSAGLCFVLPYGPPNDLFACWSSFDIAILRSKRYAPTSKSTNGSAGPFAGS